MPRRASSRAKRPFSFLDDCAQSCASSPSSFGRRLRDTHWPSYGGTSGSLSGLALSPNESTGTTETAKEWDRAEAEAFLRPPPTPSTPGSAQGPLTPQARRASPSARSSRSSPPVSPTESPPGRSLRFQSWFGTWIPAPPDAHALERFNALPECRVLVVGKETCPKTGTPHLQFVFQTKATRLSFRAACRLLPNCWVRPLVKPLEAAIKYCKGETRAKRRLGPPNQLLLDVEDLRRRGPKRTREVASEAAWAACVAGDPRPLLKEMDPQTQVAHCKRIKEATLTLPLLLGTRTERKPPYFIWVYGAPGVGKTTFAKSLSKSYAADCTFTVSPPREGSKGVWMDGYLPAVHRLVLLDDARPTWLGPGELLTLCNSTSRSVEWKGASTPFAASVMLVTTTETPWEFYSQSPLEAAQVARRVNFLVEVGPSSPARTALPTGALAGATSSLFRHPSSPCPATAAPSTETGSTATSAATTARWGDLMPSNSLEEWLRAMNAPRAAPCVSGRVLVCRASPEGGETHEEWEAKALTIADRLGFERAYLRYRV